MTRYKGLLAAGGLPLLFAAVLAQAAPSGAPASAGHAFRTGPKILQALPAGAGDPAAFLPWADGGQGPWAADLLARVRATADRAGGILLVGRTDSVGPRSLNRALGLQYAVAAARRLAPMLGLGLERFACATEGEEAGAWAGVAAYPWVPTTPGPTAPPWVTFLEPAAGLPRGERVWAIWDAAAKEVLWGWKTPSGVRLWEVPDSGTALSLSLPALAQGMAVGGTYREAAEAAAAADLPAAGYAEDLSLRVMARGLSWARLEVRVPRRYARPVLWAAGIPYPVVPGKEGSVELTVALFPQENGVYLQALDPVGEAVTSGVLTIQGDGEELPALMAVLVWEGEGVDLDLHAWKGARHTHPQDPDPAFSPGAIPGTRLLFDGNDRMRAAAFAAEEADGLGLDVLCYSDLTGKGGRAWLYLAEKPGDPLQARYRILGPRRLSEAPLEVRWPALPETTTEL